MILEIINNPAFGMLLGTGCMAAIIAIALYIITRP